MSSRLRKRSKTGETISWETKSVPAGSTTGAVTMSSFNQTTLDEPTHWMEAKKSGVLSAGDWGGDFYSESVSSTYAASSRFVNKLVGARFGQTYYFTGVVLPRLDTLTSGEGSAFPSLPAFNHDNMVSKGTTAIARCMPTNPTSSASTFAGELMRDGLPKGIGTNMLVSSNLFKDRIHFFRSLGDEYLNVEFGWKPFFNDLQKLFTSVKDSHKILEQYERDSGKAIRRGYRFPSMGDEVSNLYSNKNVQVYPLGASASYADLTGYGVQNGFRTKSVDTWFRGAFTYYLTRGDELRGRMERHAQEAEKLLGLKLTPETLWNLAPWSWAADWVSNMGDVLTNLTRFSSSDSTVLRYGYIMERTSIVDFHTTAGCTWQNGTKSGQASLRREIVRKTRSHATPFGFRPDAALDFTARQSAIIGALGLSRGKRVAW